MPDCYTCGGVPAYQPQQYLPTVSPVARWQVAYPNGQVVLYLNEDQAHSEAAKQSRRLGKIIVAEPYVPPGERVEAP